MEPQIKGTIMIFIVNYITNIMINFDHGIIPACTREMKADLQLDDFEIGAIGSSVYAGLVVGSVVGSQIFTIFKSNQIVYCSVLGCISSLCLFLITKSIYVLIFSRFLVGFFQIFLVIFFPVWIDFYGGKSKTLWLTFTQLGVALGAVAGYCVTSIFIQQNGNWTHPYTTQIILLIPCAVFYIIVPDYMLDTSGKQLIQNDEFSQKTQMGKLKFLVSNQIFSYTVLSLSALFFVVNGMQFWVSDYFRNVLQVPQTLVFKSYMLVSLSAPILGIAVGGFITHINGGYDGDNALKISQIQALLASLCGTAIPFVNNFPIAITMFWFLLFFGASVVPGVTGIMISSIPPNTRSYGNSISHVFQELFGYLPSPMLYGLVVQLTGGDDSRWGMILLITWSYTGVIYLYIASRYQKKLKLISDLENQIEMELQEKKIENQEKQISNPFKIHEQFFIELRQNTSMSLGQSQVCLPSSQRNRRSLDTQLIKSFHQATRSIKAKPSLISVMSFTADIVGRGSIDIMIKRFDEHSEQEETKEYDFRIRKTLISQT